MALLGVLPTQGAVHAVAGEREGLFTSGGHFLEYALLAALMAAAWGGSTRSRYVLAAAFVGAAGLGAAIESLQAPLPYRDFQIGDLAANAAGAAAGVAAFSLAVWAAGRPRRSHRG